MSTPVRHPPSKEAPTLRRCTRSVPQSAKPAEQAEGVPEGTPMNPLEKMFTVFEGKRPGVSEELLSFILGSMDVADKARFAAGPAMPAATGPLCHRTPRCWRGARDATTPHAVSEARALFPACCRSHCLVPTPRPVRLSRPTDRRRHQTAPPAGARFRYRTPPHATPTPSPSRRPPRRPASAAASRRLRRPRRRDLAPQRGWALSGRRR